MYQANNVVVPMLEMHGLNVLDPVVTEKNKLVETIAVGMGQAKDRRAEPREEQAEQIID